MHSPPLAPVRVTQGARPRYCQSIAVRMTIIGMASHRESRSFLKPAIDGFQPLQRVQELEADVSHLIRTRRELLRVLDGKPYAVDGNTRLVRHLELHCCGLALRPSLNQFKDLFLEFAFHICSQFRLQSPDGSAQAEFYGRLSFAPKVAPHASERRQTFAADTVAERSSVSP